jgi:hypothetical protein
MVDANFRLVREAVLRSPVPWAEVSKVFAAARNDLGADAPDDAVWVEARVENEQLLIVARWDVSGIRIDD